ncbi:MAG: MFS transporter [Rhizobiaceae bacterium]
MDAVETIRWRGVIASIASISVVGIAIGLAIPLLSTILENRGYSATLIGLNTAMAGIASLAAAPVATPLAVRYGVVPLLLVAIVTTALSFCAFYFATEFWMWFPLRVVLHGALTMVFILSEFWITASAPADRRGFVLGIYATLLSGGFALGPWLFAVLGSGGFAPFGAGTALVLASIVPVLAAVRHGPRLEAGERQGGVIRYSLVVPTATAAVLVFGAVETGGFALFPVYGARIGYSEADAALLISMIGLGNVALQLPLGIVSDRVGDRRVMLAALAAIGFAGILLLPLTDGNWPMAALLMFFWGGATGGLYVVGLAHLGAKLSGRELAAANAAFVFCYSLGMLAGPQVIGIGMDITGPAGFAWTIALFFFVYTAFALRRIARHT